MKLKILDRQQIVKSIARLACSVPFIFSIVFLWMMREEIMRVLEGEAEGRGAYIGMTFLQNFGISVVLLLIMTLFFLVKGRQQEESPSVLLLFCSLCCAFLFDSIITTAFLVLLLLQDIISFDLDVFETLLVNIGFFVASSVIYLTLRFFTLRLQEASHSLLILLFLVPVIFIFLLSPILGLCLCFGLVAGTFVLGQVIDVLEHWLPSYLRKS